MIHEGTLFYTLNVYSGYIQWFNGLGKFKFKICVRILSYFHFLQLPKKSYTPLVVTKT